MIVLRTKLLALRIAVNTCRSLCIRAKKPRYWHAKFPDLQPRSFDEMPTAMEYFNPYKHREIYPRLFKENGYIVRQVVGNEMYVVHTCHFEDFDAIHQEEAKYVKRWGKPSQRFSHTVPEDYREKHKDLYYDIGVEPGDGEYVERIRKLMRNSMSTIIDEKLEEVADDLIKILQAQVGEGGEIEIETWLFLWALENVGVKFLDKRLGALFGNEEADMMLQALAVINEMVILTMEDPTTNYAESSETARIAERYFCRVLKKHINDCAADPNSKSAVKRLLEDNPKAAITTTLDSFLGALQTVPRLALMAFLNLAVYKDVQAQARRELMDCMPTKDMKYCSIRIMPDIIENIVWETLRLRPPIICSEHIIQSDMVLGGYMVPKETSVFLHTRIANKLEEFFENPLKFDPNRFQGVSYDPGRNLFAVGSWRSCIGFKFATDTLSLILLKMLRNFEISCDVGEITMVNELHNGSKLPGILKLKPLPK